MKSQPYIGESSAITCLNIAEDKSFRPYASKLAIHRFAFTEIEQQRSTKTPARTKSHVPDIAEVRESMTTGSQFLPICLPAIIDSRKP